jgi:hypothetical protein
MKTAIRARVNTMSARRRRLGTGAKSTRYRKPRECNSRRTASSADVSRRLFASIDFLVPWDEAQDAVSTILSPGS